MSFPSFDDWARGLYEIGETIGLGKIGRQQERLVMPDTRTKFPNLAGVATALAKLHHEIETDAAKLVETAIPALVAKKDHVLKKAHGQLANYSGAVDALGQELDALDTLIGDNGGPLEQSPIGSGQPDPAKTTQ